MKILFIGSRVSNHTKKWTDAFVERGHEVMVVCKNEKSTQSVKFHPSVKLHVMKFGGIKSYILNIPEIRKIYKEFKPDVVNVHYVSGYGTMARLARLRPLVLNCYGHDIFTVPNSGWIQKTILRRTLNYADAIASTSKAMADAAREVLNDPNREITVTPFGVDVDRFSPSLNRIQHDRPIITIVKYLKPIYDIELLIRGFSLAYEQLDIKPLLKIYGGGPLKDELVALAKSLGKEDSISFYETIPNSQVPDVIRDSDIFVNCSKKESFGVTVVEGMACGVPVVVTDCPGPREVVVDGVTGIILKDRNPQTMADAFVSLLKDESLRNKMGKAGRERVLELYDWKKNYLLLEGVYEKVIKNYHNDVII